MIFRFPENCHRGVAAVNEWLSQTSRWLGIGGVVLLVAGVFCPMVHAPVRGVLSLMGAGPIQGWLIILFSAVALVQVLAKKSRGVWLPAAGSLCMIAWTFVSLNFQMHHAKYKYLGKLGGTFLGDMATGFVKQNTHLHWGIYILACGLIFIITAAVLNALSGKTR
jgi:hypothetical protein